MDERQRFVRAYWVCHEALASKPEALDVNLRGLKSVFNSVDWQDSVTQMQLQRGLDDTTRYLKTWRREGLKYNLWCAQDSFDSMSEWVRALANKKQEAIWQHR